LIGKLEEPKSSSIKRSSSFGAYYSISPGKCKHQHRRNIRLFSDTWSWASQTTSSESNQRQSIQWRLSHRLGIPSTGESC